MFSQKIRDNDTATPQEHEPNFFGRGITTVAGHDTKELFHTEPSSATSVVTSDVFGAITVSTAARHLSLTVNVGLSDEARVIRAINRILSGEAPEKAPPETR